MHWNYRIFKDDSGYCHVREVYYNQDKTINCFTENAVAPIAETPEELIGVLEMMLNDVKKSKNDVLDDNLSILNTKQ